MINRKGVFSFLIITFGITYLIESIVILSGVRIGQVPPVIIQYTVMIAMWVPSLATFITVRYITHEKFNTTGLRFGPSWKPYAVTALIVPIIYLVTYGITWLLGLGSPDWQLREFYGMIANLGTDMSTAPDPKLLLVGLLLGSLFVGPFFNSILGFGEEWGWRGYLLPRLMPLGKLKAYLIVGVAWGLWHALLVLIGFNYPGYPVLGIFMMIALTTAIGIYMNELTLRYKSAVLAGWIHGVFNSQAYGIWRFLLFANTQPILGGITGLVGIVILTLVGFATIKWAKRSAPVSVPPAVNSI